MRTPIQRRYLLIQRCKHCCTCDSSLQAALERDLTLAFLLWADSERRGKTSKPRKSLWRTDTTCTQMSWWVAENLSANHSWLKCCSRRPWRPSKSFSPVRLTPPGASDRWQEPRVRGGHDPRGGDRSHHQRFLPRYLWKSERPPPQSRRLLRSFPTSHFFPCPQFNFIRPHATLLMTGSHTLAELRDAICCVSDLQVCGEFSSNPDAAPAFISKVSESGGFFHCTAQHVAFASGWWCTKSSLLFQDHFKSAFFYFEGVFYNDMRFPECVDISRSALPLNLEPKNDCAIISVPK